MLQTILLFTSLVSFFRLLMWYFNQLIGYLNRQIVHFLDIFSLVKKSICTKRQECMAVLRIRVSSKHDDYQLGFSGFDILEHCQPLSSLHAEIQYAHILIQAPDTLNGLDRIATFPDNINSSLLHQHFFHSVGEHSVIVDNKGFEHDDYVSFSNQNRSKDQQDHHRSYKAEFTWLLICNRGLKT